MHSANPQLADMVQELRPTGRRKRYRTARSCQELSIICFICAVILIMSALDFASAATNASNLNMEDDFIFAGNATRISYGFAGQLTDSETYPRSAGISDNVLNFAGPVVPQVGPLFPGNVEYKIRRTRDATAWKGKPDRSKAQDYTKKEKLKLLGLHNMYRMNVTPPAANMKYMEWDEELAVYADLWAQDLVNRGCILEHGRPPEASSYPEYFGQNLYVGGDRSGLEALFLWFDEYRYYTFKTRDCIKGKMCGHYTQMVWDDSYKLGCEVAMCTDGRHYIVVCHYGPGGNVAGVHPYLVEVPCSQCDTPDGGLCYQNQCTCNLRCHNCGVLDSASCQCKCKHGWDSPDCSGEITDTDRKELVNLCCGGKMCPRGEVLLPDEGLCYCHTLCPGPKCESAGYRQRMLWALLMPLVIFISFVFYSWAL